MYIWVGWITDGKDMSLSRLRQLVMDRVAWRAAVHGVTKSRTRLSDWTELMCIVYLCLCSSMPWVQRAHGARLWVAWVECAHRARLWVGCVSSFSVCLYDPTLWRWAHSSTLYGNYYGRWPFMYLHQTLRCPCSHCCYTFPSLLE